MERIQHLQQHKARLKEQNCGVKVDIEHCIEKIDLVEKEKNEAYTNCCTLLENAKKLEAEARELVRKTAEYKPWSVFSVGRTLLLSEFFLGPVGAVLYTGVYQRIKASSQNEKLKEVNIGLDEASANVRRVRKRKGSFSNSIETSVEKIRCLTETVQFCENEVQSIENQIQLIEDELMSLRNDCLKPLTQERDLQTVHKHQQKKKL